MDGVISEWTKYHGVFGQTLIKPFYHGTYCFLKQFKPAHYILSKQLSKSAVGIISYSDVYNGYVARCWLVWYNG